MKILLNKIKGKTYVRYFFSYFIIFSLLILGFFFVVRTQFSKKYLEQLSIQSEAQVDNVVEELRDDLVFLSQIDESLCTNIQLIMSRHSTGGWQEYQAYQEIKKYDFSNKLINAICYLPNNANRVLTSNYTAFYEDDIFRIIDVKQYEEDQVFYFDPEPYFNDSSGQLIPVYNDTDSRLIYFPAQNVRREYIFFYILDTNEIRQRMKSLVSDAMPAVAFIDADGRIITGINSEQFEPYMDSFKLEDGIHEIEANSSIYVNHGISKGFSVISLISNDSLHRQLGEAFANAYLILFLIGCVGFGLVLFAMKITYKPLRELTQKIVSDTSLGNEYLEQLDAAFTNMLEQNQLLEVKFENYRRSVKKTLLDSVLSSNYADGQSTLPNIDQLFDPRLRKKIYAVQMKSYNGPIPHVDIQNMIQEALPGDDSCIILKSDVNSVMFLINYTGSETNKDENIKVLLNDIYLKWGVLSAISNGSSSPMDIPSLCEKAINAGRRWPGIPVVDYNSLPVESAFFEYPYDQLEQLSERLNDNNFFAVNNIIKYIFKIIDDTVQEENPLPDFYVRSILVDLIIAIVNYMNEVKINYKSYEDLFYETLYFCRSCPYKETSKEITDNIQKLLDICKQEVGTHISAMQIKQLIKESYCQPNFSIYELADKLNLSFTYTSNLVKKELNQNFSDYLWELRLEKAKELLEQTDMSVDEVSLAVGYISASSFRRKFKQEIGLTPSQFRAISMTMQ